MAADDSPPTVPGADSVLAFVAIVAVASYSTSFTVDPYTDSLLAEVVGAALAAVALAVAGTLVRRWRR
jgi:hypothetical protein